VVDSHIQKAHDGMCCRDARSRFGDDAEKSMIVAERQECFANGDDIGEGRRHLGRASRPPVDGLRALPVGRIRFGGEIASPLHRGLQERFWNDGLVWIIDERGVANARAERDRARGTPLAGERLGLGHCVSREDQNATRQRSRASAFDEVDLRNLAERRRRHRISGDIVDTVVTGRLAARGDQPDGAELACKGASGHRRRPQDQARDIAVLERGEGSETRSEARAEKNDANATLSAPHARANFGDGLLDTLHPSPDSARISEQTSGVTRSVVVEPKGRDSRASEAFAQPSKCPVQAHRLCSERLAQHGSRRFGLNILAFTCADTGWMKHPEEGSLRGTKKEALLWRERGHAGYVDSRRRCDRRATGTPPGNRRVAHSTHRLTGGV
jgi:hypothetical protein